MHRDEAIYARSDARGVTLTAEEAATVAVWARNASDTIRAFGPFVVMGGVTPEWCDALAVRLEAASTTPSP